MAKVTDIQDKTGVSKEIQDKDLANRTAQSTVASSDYVLLEDTSGAYHKIAKASFTEAVRGALGSVINSVAKGTDIAKIPVLDSSNDLGMGTLANVASVLGDTQTLTDNDFNSKKNGWRYVNENTANNDFPVDHKTGVLINTTYSLWDGKQTFYNTVGEIYNRALRGGNWQSWVRVDNFGCETASQLASLLGGIKLLSIPQHDCDLAVEQGIYHVSHETSDQHMPSASGYYEIITFKQTKWPVQFAFEVLNNTVYFRATSHDDFTNVAWKQIGT